MTSAAVEQARWIRCFHPSQDSAQRLVCFPHAGGAASYYFGLSAALTPGVEVLAVQYPGRQDRRREPLVGSIADLVEPIAGALEGWVGAPYSFFGHSMGAIVAYEVARRLQEIGTPGPQRLFASGRRAPSRHRPGDVHKRDDAGFIEELRLLGGTDQRFLADPEILELALPPTRNDYKAVETYVHAPGRELECPISVLIGSDDPQSTVEEARAWSEHTAGDTDVQVFPGGHFYLDTRRAEVTAAIRTALAAR